ncbi:hypothetical protein B0H17DRAFT_1050117 [Mycena rosella]|uniref:Uncharacterized protein n=1 Tax=Mycena rosella TaxID=1033263 RepID=A0AAD7DTD2_MYCRO|nr:hypothetical protein B0H17DRAFT_1050117 [Mycena rosella]
MPVDLAHCTAYCSNATSLLRGVNMGIVRPAQDLAHIRDYAFVMGAVGLLISGCTACWVLSLVFRRIEPHYMDLLSKGILVFGFTACLAAVGGGEFLLNGKWLPTGEPPRAVGQWAPLVSVALAVLWDYLSVKLSLLFEQRGSGRSVEMELRVS